MQENDKEYRQVRLLSYQACKDFMCFCFSVYHPDVSTIKIGPKPNTPNMDIKFRKSYIFVRRTIKEIETLTKIGEYRKALIEEDDEVTILKSWNCLEKIQFQDIKEYQWPPAPDDYLETQGTEPSASENTYQELRLTFFKPSPAD